MQVFPKSMNPISRLMVLGLPLMLGGGAVGLAAFFRSDYTTGARDIVEQPVPFSHLHHVSQLGIDCRYCHTAFETSATAGIPPTKTCMNCHSQIFANSPFLEPVRESFRTGRSLQWNRVHDLPDFVYFDHSIHLNKASAAPPATGRSIGCR